jgi:hypothetical protein
MLDRNNDVFQIYNLRFLNKSDFSKDLKNTLIDGVRFYKVCKLRNEFDFMD